MPFKIFWRHLDLNNTLPSADRPPSAQLVAPSVAFQKKTKKTKTASPCTLQWSHWTTIFYFVFWLYHALIFAEKVKNDFLHSQVHSSPTKKIHNREKQTKHETNRPGVLFCVIKICFPSSSSRSGDLRFFLFRAIKKRIKKVRGSVFLFFIFWIL